MTITAEIILWRKKTFEHIAIQCSQKKKSNMISLFNESIIRKYDAIVNHFRDYPK